MAALAGRLLRNAAAPPIELDAPKLIEVTALHPEANRMVVHLLNCTALSSGSNQMAPLANVGIQLNQRTARRARLAIANRELEVHSNHLVVPAVGHSEVVVMELE